MFKKVWTQPDCRELRIIETRHRPIDPSTFLSVEVGKISTGLEKGFILPTRSISYWREIGEKQSKIDGRVG